MNDDFFSKNILIGNILKNVATMHFLYNRYEMKDIRISKIMKKRTVLQINSYLDENKTSINFQFNISDTINIKSYLNREDKKGFSVEQYLDYQRTSEAKHFIDYYPLNINNLEHSLETYFSSLKQLFDGELYNVVYGTDWIDVPSIDPRDLY